MAAGERRVLTPEQRAEWRQEAIANADAPAGERILDHRILALLDALDAAEASAAEQVTAALDEMERRIRNARPRVFGPLDAARIVRDYREEVRRG